MLINNSELTVADTDNRYFAWLYHFEMELQSNKCKTTDDIMII